jgi:hypothetical protein
MYASRKPRCIAHKDADRTYYVIPQDKLPDGVSPPVEVWWKSEPRKPGAFDYEFLVVRQDNGKSVDVLMLTLGQVYDMIDALNQAVMKP